MTHYAEHMTWPDPELAILIPAAGMGTRLGLGPKAWLTLDGSSMLNRLASKAKTVAGSVLIAAPPGEKQKMAELCPGCSVLKGGATRQQSVALLVQASHAKYLMIQDAARPFVSATLLRAVALAARESGAAAAFLDPEVPVARLADGWATAQYASSEVGILQAPQAFSRDILEQSLAAAECAGWSAQSICQLVMFAGFPVRSVPGEKTNIKLTTPADWQMAQGLKHLL